METETYSMTMTCSNCGSNFDINIIKGEKVPLLSTCSYCGVTGGNHGSRPHWVIQAQGMSNCVNPYK